MRIVLIILLPLLINSCNSSTQLNTQTTNRDNRQTIDSLMNNWHRAAANGNLTAYIGAMDTNSIYIGTDATENWKRDEFETFCKPYFDKKTTWDFKTLSRNIYLSVNQQTAWFDELLKTHMGTCRGSGTLELKENGWKIKHYVLSLTIPNDDMEAVKEAKKKNDDAFLATFE